MAASTSWMLTEGASVAKRAPHVARFESIGVKLPEKCVTTSELMASTRHRTRIDLERLTGIHERRVCSAGETSLSLAIDAAKDCLARSERKASELDMIVSASITRYVEPSSHRFEPPFSASIKEAIGAHGARSFDVSNACAGMLTGVFLLNDFVRRGVIRRGMVVSGEFISGLGVNAASEIRGIYSRQLASLTLGDAGAAVIVERADDGKPGIAFTAFTTISEHSRLCIGSPAAHAPGARMFTRARKIHEVAMIDAPPLLEEIMRETGLSIGDIDWLIPHQTSARAIRAGERELRARLGASPKHVVCNVERFGNTASTTHFVALHRYLSEGRFARGERVMLLALASGLQIGVVVLELDRLVERFDHGHAH